MLSCMNQRILTNKPRVSKLRLACAHWAQNLLIHAGAGLVQSTQDILSKFAQKTDLRQPSRLEFGTGHITK
jgi:hypothetical protein